MTDDELVERIARRLGEDIPSLNSQHKAVVARAFLPVVKAGVNFTDKCESGRARSVQSYGEFKAALRPWVGEEDTK